MPQRTLTLLEMVLGLIAVAALLSVGADLALAARRGPPWKRRILGAGLALAILLGFGACAEREAVRDEPAEPGSPSGKAPETKGSPSTEPGTGKSPGAAPGKPKPPEAEEESAKAKRERLVHAWQELMLLWVDAGELVSGKRGVTPPPVAEKKHLLEAMERAPAQIDAFVSAGIISAGEGMQLKRDLERLAGAIFKIHPKVPESVTCYVPLPLPDQTPTRGPLHTSIETLRDRVDLLERLTRNKRLRPEVLEKVLTTVDFHCRALEETGVLAGMKAPERRRVTALRERVKKLVQTIKEQRRD
ncbi:MAG: hypothetical protein ACYTHM_11605 [Planctomycetota bacterium]|jgi:hypothetical protein